MQAVSALLAEGTNPTEILQLLLRGFDVEVLEKRNTEYYCGCSLERTKQVLQSLGREELLDMQKSRGTAEVLCHFCNEKYEIHLADLLAQMP